MEPHETLEYSPQFIELVILYSDMKADPDNFEKRAIYFEKLADARLSDYYTVSDQLAKLKPYVAFCESCAKSGEKPMTFEEFQRKAVGETEGLIKA